MSAPDWNAVVKTSALEVKAKAAQLLQAETRRYELLELNRLDNLEIARLNDQIADRAAELAMADDQIAEFQTGFHESLKIHTSNEEARKDADSFYDDVSVTALSTQQNMDGTDRQEMIAQMEEPRVEDDLAELRANPENVAQRAEEVAENLRRESRAETMRREKEAEGSPKRKDKG